MDAKICAQCTNIRERAGCKMCFKKGRSMKECLNFYPKLGTPLFLKWLRIGKLFQYSIDDAKKLIEKMKDKDSVK